MATFGSLAIWMYAMADISTVITGMLCPHFSLTQLDVGVQETCLMINQYMQAAVLTQGNALTQENLEKHLVTPYTSQPSIWLRFCT